MNYKILVNKDHKYSFPKIKLIKFKNIYNAEIKVEKKTYKNYLKLQKYLKKLGYIIDVESGYRSFLEQEKLFYEILSLKGIDHTLKYVMLPGYSEHHTGLAIDLILIKENKPLFDFDIKDKDFLNLLHNNLYKFGFILRYPKDKEKITKISYEPWHIRYVGKNLAKKMNVSNLCLEEIKKDD